MAKRKSSAAQLDKIIEEAYKRFRFALDSEADNHKRAEEAILFRDLEQWPQKIKEARENDVEGARPCLVLDKINQYLNQVKNDQRQNRPSIKVRPVDDKADPKVARVIQGLIRNIEDVSRAGVAYDTAHDHTLDGGFGYWRILTDYMDDKSFDQEPRIVRIRNRFSVLLDPNHQQPDGSDAKWGFVFESLSHEEFETQFAGAKKVSFDEYGGIAEGWVGEDYVIVAEYFRIVEKREEIAQLPDGSVVPMDEVPEGVKPVKTRKSKKCTVEWRKLTAAEELDFRELPGQYIPIVQVVGNEIDYKGKRRLSGLIRGGMDPQRMFNYAGSAFVELVALQPRAPYVAAEGQLEGRESDWKSANRRNISVLQYKPVIEDGVLLPAPQRQPMPGIPAGWQQAMQNFEHDLQASMGMYASNLGADTQATSGKQELALQRRGDTATFHYQDNLSLAIQHTGRILLEYIPVYYDTAKIIRILGEDGNEDYVRIDPELEAAIKTIHGPEGKTDYYNLTFGRYDVTVITGPNHVTKRLEAQDFASQMASAAKDPITAQIMTYLAIKNSDWAGADEATRMIKTILPPQLQDEDEMADLPPEVQQAIAQAQAQIQQKEQAIQMAAQELQKLEEQAKGEGDMAKDAKAQIDQAIAKLEQERQAIANDRKMLAMAERLASAEMESEHIKQTAALEKMLRDAEDKLTQAQTTEQGNADAAKVMAEQVAGSHEQVMEILRALIATIATPRVKKSRITGPSGQVYEQESTESMITEGTN